MKNYLTQAIDKASKTKKIVTDSYDNHIRQKAMSAVLDKLKDKGLSVEDIDKEDYEVMVNDSAKDIQSDYNKKIAQVGLTALGLDLLFGL